MTFACDAVVRLVQKLISTAFACARGVTSKASAARQAHQLTRPVNPPPRWRPPNFEAMAVPSLIKRQSGELPPKGAASHPPRGRYPGIWTIIPNYVNRRK